ncbi:hypothetical protein [Salinivibrio socompensis]|uniref:hypothetical protein n=1 Tax=Salinivibrio socompensis TaxID=1510206 RepID=UPI00046EF9DE|nr:hypothetical protein [Salinivibrio socompensis]
MARGAGEGVIREGATEAMQGGTQQYVANEVSNEFAGTDLDPMDGVALGAVNEGVLGGAIGGTVGAAGGARTRADKAMDTADAVEGDLAQTDGQAENAKGDPVVDPAQGADGAQSADAPQGVNGVQQAEGVQGLDGTQPVNTEITDGPTQAAERIRQQLMSKADSESVLAEQEPSGDQIQDALKEKFKSSQQSLREKGVLPDNDNHFVKTVKLAYAMDQDKADALLNRIEQGDQDAEQSLYALAEQASELGVDETGVQQAFSAAREKQQQAIQGKRDSKVQRYIDAIEQGRENIAASSQSDAQPNLETSLSFDEQGISDLPTAAAERVRTNVLGAETQSATPNTDAPASDIEAAYQQQAMQESIKANVGQSAQSRGEFASRPNTMKMREDGKKPIADYTAITKKTKSMRKRLKKRMAQSNPKLREALLESLRNAPERIAAFELEAKERKARFNAQTENQARRQQAEALFDQQPESVSEPDFSRNAIKQVIDDMRERGEPIIQSLPKEEQAEARADLKKAQSFATTKLRMMMDEAKANRKGTFADFTPKYQPDNQGNEQALSDQQAVDYLPQNEAEQAPERDQSADGEHDVDASQSVDDAQGADDAQEVGRVRKTLTWWRRPKM